MCAADQIAAESTVFKLEELVVVVVDDGAIALHLVAEQVLLLDVSAMSIERERHRVGERSRPLERILGRILCKVEKRL